MARRQLSSGYDRAMSWTKTQVRRPPVGISGGRVVLGGLVLGSVYGAGTSTLNHTGPGILSGALGHGAAWAGLGLVVGLVLRRLNCTVLWCVIGVVVTFSTASIFYYASDVLWLVPGTARLQQDIESGVTPPLPRETPVQTVGDLLSGQFTEALYWVMFSVLLGVPVGLAGVLMARQDGIGLATRCAAPVILLCYMFMTVQLPPEGVSNRAITVVVATCWMLGNVLGEVRRRKLSSR
jgi:hypothetical protein